MSYILAGSLVKGAPHPHPACPIPPGSPHPRAYGEDRNRPIQSASRVRAGTRLSDLRAWKPFPVTASDNGAGRSHKLNTGHAILAVENSWPCMTGGPSGRDDLSKAGAISSQSCRARGHVQEKRLTTAR